MSVKKYKHVPVEWRRQDFLKKVTQCDLLPDKSSQTLAFHISEMLECCRDFSQKIRDLRLCLAKDGALPDKAGRVIAEIEHIKYHVNGMSRPMDRLLESALERQAKAKDKAKQKVKKKAKKKVKRKPPAKKKKTRKSKTRR